MKLVHVKSNLIAEFNENQVLEIVIENPQIYAEYLNELKMQVQSENGSFVLSENNNEINLSKNVEIIVDLWNLDFDSKKIKTKLFQFMKENSADYLYEDFLKLRTNLCLYTEKIIEQTPYSLTYTPEMDEASIYKLLDVRIDKMAESLIENLIEYLKLTSSLCNISIFFLVNIKSFFTKDEIDELYKSAFYEKITLILLENSFTEKAETEKVIIIDKDDCFIEI